MTSKGNGGQGERGPGRAGAPRAAERPCRGAPVPCEQAGTTCRRPRVVAFRLLSCRMLWLSVSLVAVSRQNQPSAWFPLRACGGRGRACDQRGETSLPAASPLLKLRPRTHASAPVHTHLLPGSPRSAATGKLVVTSATCRGPCDAGPLRQVRVRTRGSGS